MPVPIGIRGPLIVIIMRPRTGEDGRASSLGPGSEFSP
jgi:hypothetical protein